MTTAEFLAELDAIAQVIAFVLATFLPALVVGGVFWLSRRMRLVWRSVLVMVANVVSLPIAFVIVMLVVMGWPPSGTPAMGVAALPSFLVWQLTVVGSIVLLLVSAFSRSKAR